MLCLRFFTVYGPRQRPDLAIRKFTELMIAGKPIPLFGSGTSERDYTWVDDIVNGVLAGIDRGRIEPNEFQVVNLGGNRTIELRLLVALLGDALGVKPQVQHLPPQPGDVERTYADLTKARQLLGYQPAVSLEDGIERFVAWFRNHA
jgi:UDP-glucuronate 4-epimerase